MDYGISNTGLLVCSAVRIQKFLSPSVRLPSANAEMIPKFQDADVCISAALPT